MENNKAIEKHNNIDLKFDNDDDDDDHDDDDDLENFIENNDNGDVYDLEIKFDIESDDDD